MTTQFIVAVMLDGTLNVSAAGPFRSRRNAEAAAERINRAGEWSVDDLDAPTIIAQVVLLAGVDDLVKEIRHD